MGSCSLLANRFITKYFKAKSSQLNTNSQFKPINYSSYKLSSTSKKKKEFRKGFRKGFWQKVYEYIVRSMKNIKMFIEKKSKEKRREFILPSDFSLLKYSYIVFIVPLFILHFYILGININSASNFQLFLGVLFSSSFLYLSFVVLWNIWHKNKNNIYISINYLLNSILNRNIVPLLTIFIIFLSFFITLNMIIYYLGITNKDIIVYLYARICLLPFIVYSFNIAFCLLKNCCKDKKEKINMGLNSSDMFKAFT